MVRTAMRSVVAQAAAGDRRIERDLVLGGRDFGC